MHIKFLTWINQEKGTCDKPLVTFHAPNLRNSKLGIAGKNLQTAAIAVKQPAATHTNRNPIL
jgi:hypothetical protein